MTLRDRRARARRVRRVVSAMTVAAICLLVVAGWRGCTPDTRETVVAYVALDMIWRGGGEVWSVAAGVG